MNVKAFHKATVIEKGELDNTEKQHIRSRLRVVLTKSIKQALVL